MFTFKIYHIFSKQNRYQLFSKISIITKNDDFGRLKINNKRGPGKMSLKLFYKRNSFFIYRVYGLKLFKNYYTKLPFGTLCETKFSEYDLHIDCGKTSQISCSGFHLNLFLKSILKLNLNP